MKVQNFRIATIKTCIFNRRTKKPRWTGVFSEPSELSIDTWNYNNYNSNNNDDHRQFNNDLSDIFLDQVDNIKLDDVVYSGQLVDRHSNHRCSTVREQIPGLHNAIYKLANKSL